MATIPAVNTQTGEPDDSDELLEARRTAERAARVFFRRPTGKALRRVHDALLAYQAMFLMVPEDVPTERRVPRAVA